jgi:hypothetical protein
LSGHSTANIVKSSDDLAVSSPRAVELIRQGRRGPPRRPTGNERGRRSWRSHFANISRATKTTVSTPALITVIRNQRSCSMHWYLPAVLAAAYAPRRMALPILPPMPKHESDSASDYRQPPERETKEQSIACHNCEGWRDRSFGLVDLDQGRLVSVRSDSQFGPEILI